MAAGTNHFIHPAGYIQIIPAYLPYPIVLNYVAGICEILFALMLITKPTRKYGSCSFGRYFNYLIGRTANAIANGAATEQYLYRW